MLKFFLEQQFSLFALGLLLFGYTIQGYLLYQLQQTVLIGLFVVTYVLIQLLALVPAVQKIGRTIRWWLGSDVIHLVGLLTTAFFSAVAMIWIGALDNLLLVITIELLARFELRQANLNQIQRLVVLSACLVLSLELGWVVHALVDQPPT